MKDALSLIQAGHAGDAAEAAALDQFARAHQPVVYRFALSILEDAAEAEDAAQEALVAAVRNLDSFRGDSAITTWLYTITLNVCRRQLQKRHSRERVAAALQGLFHLKSETQERPEEKAIQAEARAGLLSAVRGLDEKHRLAVILRYYHDLPIAEIARILGVREGTVHSRLFTARERLRLRLQPEDAPPAE